MFMKMKRILTFLAVVMLLTASLPLAVPCSAETYATVISFDVLHLRDYPGTEGDIIGRYRRGTKVEVLNSSNKLWVRVRTPDGKVGYMYREYLSTFTKTDTGSAGNGQTEATGYRYIKSGIGPVNFRKNPDTNSMLINQIDGGTRVKLLSTGAVWCRIMYNGQKGRIKTKYLTKKAP